MDHEISHQNNCRNTLQIEQLSPKLRDRQAPIKLLFIKLVVAAMSSGSNIAFKMKEE